MTEDEGRILAAWQDPGVQPWYHDMVKARFEQQWPALAAAIRTLELNTQHEQKVGKHAA